MPMDKRTLPKESKPLLTGKEDELCGHLRPVLEFLLAKGVGIERRDLDYLGWPLTVVLDGFFYRPEIYGAFEVPDFVVWSWADPHYGTGNTLSCQVCRTSLESRFDLSDPDGTLGPS